MNEPTNHQPTQNIPLRKIKGILVVFSIYTYVCACGLGRRHKKKSVRVPVPPPVIHPDYGSTLLSASHF